MKTFGNLLLLFLLIELQSHVFGLSGPLTDFQFGKREKGDKLVTTSLIQKLPRKGPIELLNLPVYGKIYLNLEKELKEKITQIRLYEQKESHFEAAGAVYAKIMEGGIGSKFVALELKSKKGYGLSYEVQVYGK